LVWYNNQCVDRNYSPYTIANNIVSTVLPIPSDIGNAPFENGINAPIKGKFIERDTDGRFILNDFMKTQRINGTQPGASGLY
jgi:hypothetical protein